MKKILLEEIIKKKESKIEFAIITNLENAESCIYEKNKPLNKNFENFKDKINLQINKKKNGILELIVDKKKNFKEDFSKWAKKQGFKISGIEDDPRIVRLFIRKGSRAVKA